MTLQYSLILVKAVLLVSISADVSENKNVWSSPVNKENNYENYKSPNNAYLPPLHQPTTPPANNIYPSYQNYYNVPSVTHLPHQQYYNPGNIYSQQHNYGNSIPSNKYLPTVPQYSHYNNYNQNLNPQTGQIIPKPSPFLTVPYNMGIKAIGYMSNVLHNVHQGIHGQPFQFGGKIIPGYAAQQNTPWGYGYGAQQNTPWGYGYGAQQNTPWGYGYGAQQKTPLGYGYRTQQNVPWGYNKRNWQVGSYNTPTYNHGVYGGYNNLRNDYNNWNYPNKGNVYGYNNQNRFGQSQWNQQNNAKSSW